ncbi:hypothetical protein [uncultured Sulfitobacter sp.]|uniref:hypothetical protein n=1 Tax=uncultured Sulfitobacter sp. TaxID=191468 RepID=UPI0026184F99|nr:hypothetical protein [uncultured Sulfitobacter sp.]
MSRQADDVGPSTVVDTSRPVGRRHRAPSMPQQPEYAPSVQSAEQMPREPEHFDEADLVTREEIVKLFGNALRVR